MAAAFVVMMPAGVCKRRFRPRLLRCNMWPLAFRSELSHMQPIGAWAGDSGLLDK
jgi:hypothetical protein